MALSHSHYCRFFIVWLAPRFFIGCRWASVQLFETNGSMDDMQIFIGRILRFLLFVCLFSNLYFEVGRFTGWHHLFAVGIFWSGLSDVYRGIFFSRVIQIWEAQESTIVGFRMNETGSIMFLQLTAEEQRSRLLVQRTKKKWNAGSCDKPNDTHIFSSPLPLISNIP